MDGNYLVKFQIYFQFQLHLELQMPMLHAQANMYLYLYWIRLKKYILVLQGGLPSLFWSIIVKKR